jgi:periplasmic divalent cation tolerance protein
VKQSRYSRERQKNGVVSGRFKYWQKTCLDRYQEGSTFMTEFIEVHTTTDSKEDAQKMAEAIVSKRLAACVQVSGPITSTYWWQGKIEQAEEWVCTAKTQRELYSGLEQAIRAAHSYDVPEILAVEVIAGNAAYLDWVA